MIQFMDWLENALPGLALNMMTPEQIVKEWERLKAEWEVTKKRGPRLFVPLYEKLKTIQQKYHEKTGQSLEPDFKFW